MNLQVIKGTDLRIGDTIKTNKTGSNWTIIGLTETTIITHNNYVYDKHLEFYLVSPAIASFAHSYKIGDFIGNEKVIGIKRGKNDDGPLYLTQNYDWQTSLNLLRQAIQLKDSWGGVQFSPAYSYTSDKTTRAMRQEDHSGIKDFEPRLKNKKSKNYGFHSIKSTVNK